MITGIRRRETDCEKETDLGWIEKQKKSTPFDFTMTGAEQGKLLFPWISITTKTVECATEKKGRYRL
jgi:hypothetical protein